MTPLFETDEMQWTMKPRKQTRRDGRWWYVRWYGRGRESEICLTSVGVFFFLFWVKESDFDAFEETLLSTSIN